MTSELCWQCDSSAPPALSLYTNWLINRKRTSASLWVRGPSVHCSPQELEDYSAPRSRVCDRGSPHHQTGPSPLTDAAWWDRTVPRLPVQAASDQLGLIQTKLVLFIYSVWMTDLHCLYSLSQGCLCCVITTTELNTGHQISGATFCTKLNHQTDIQFPQETVKNKDTAQSLTDNDYWLY